MATLRPKRKEKIMRDFGVYMKQFARKARLALLLVGAVLATVGTTTQPAAALNNATNTLKVSPVRSDIEVKPGESKAVQITVSNLTGDDITVRPITNDFIAGDESGTPALILDEDKTAPTHSLKRFLSPLADVTIPAKQAKTIDVVVTVPSDAQAGGYFGAVRFAPTSPDGGGQVNLSASVASLILLSVPGKTVEQLKLTDFSVKQGSRTGTFFNTPKDLNATFRFQSTGNVQVAPFGKISVKQGNKVVYEADFNDGNPRDMILPDSARRWDVPLKELGTFGHFTAVATLTYGSNNQTIEAAQSFWIIPTWAVIIGIVLLILIVGAAVAGIWYIRRRNQRMPRTHTTTGRRL